METKKLILYISIPMRVSESLLQRARMFNALDSVETVDPKVLELTHVFQGHILF